MRPPPRRKSTTSAFVARCAYGTAPPVCPCSFVLSCGAQAGASLFFFGPPFFFCWFLSPPPARRGASCLLLVSWFVPNDLLTLFSSFLPRSRFRPSFVFAFGPFVSACRSYYGRTFSHSSIHVVGTRALRVVVLQRGKSSDTWNCARDPEDFGHARGILGAATGWRCLRIRAMFHRRF
jgi:hypothetical protein